MRIPLGFSPEKALSLQGGHAFLVLESLLVTLPTIDIYRSLFYSSLQEISHLLANLEKLRPGRFITP